MSWSSLASAAIPAVIGAGTAIYGAQQQGRAAQQVANATRDAAQVQAQTNDGSLDFLRESRDLARNDLAPYRDAGAADYQNYRNQVGGSFQTSPGYEFARSEGIRGIDQAASARGLIGSGARARELMRYGTGVANQEYGNWMNRLQGLAGVGQTASGQTASLGQQAGQNLAATNSQGGSALANLAMQTGQANAQGTVGQANALLGGVNQGVGLWSLMRGQ
jgi:hypothetical protein